MKLSKKKIIVGSSVTAALAVVAAVAGFSYISAGESTQIVSKETTVEKGNLTSGVSESGTVVMGSLEQEVDLGDSSSSSSSSSSGGASMMGGSSSGSSSTSLEVEEVYVSVGQVVQAGDPILKISDESLAEYLKELNDAVDTAQAALDSANVTAKSEKLDATYNYNTNIAEGNVAQAEYDATVAELQAAIDSAQVAVDESATKIGTYTALIADGKDYTAALNEEQANYNSLLAKLSSAQSAYATGIVSAQEKYEEAMLNYNNASAIYSVETNNIYDDVEDAEDDLADAKEALSDFTEAVGDGIIYAEYSGTIASVNYAEGDELSSSDTLVTYQDTADVSITVSVSEEDITSISIGDSVYIELTAYEDVTYEGVVSGIDTSESSGNSTVSYDVTVAFSGDTTGIYADMTGNVTFVTAEVDDVLYISKKAIITEDDKYYVDRKNEDGTIERVEVETGFTDGVYVEIKSGLDEGDIVLIESQVSA